MQQHLRPGVQHFHRFFRATGAKLAGEVFRAKVHRSQLRMRAAQRGGVRHTVNRLQPADDKARFAPRPVTLDASQPVQRRVELFDGLELRNHDAVGVGLPRGGEIVEVVVRFRFVDADRQRTRKLAAAQVGDQRMKTRTRGRLFSRWRAVLKIDDITVCAKARELCDQVGAVRRREEKASNGVHGAFSSFS
jgi:hypothetical protein